MRSFFLKGSLRKTFRYRSKSFCPPFPKGGGVKGAEPFLRSAEREIFFLAFLSANFFFAPFSCKEKMGYRNCYPADGGALFDLGSLVAKRTQRAFALCLQNVVVIGCRKTPQAEFGEPPCKWHGGSPKEYGMRRILSRRWRGFVRLGTTGSKKNAESFCSLRSFWCR